MERFLKASRKPALLEPGEALLPLERDRFSIELRGGKLVIEAWDESRHIVRRVMGIRQEKPGRLDLTVERFGKREGTVTLLDAARAKNDAVRRQGTRLTFREQFRRFLQRQFPGWRIAELSTEADLERSFSPSYPRALMRKGSAAWAVIGATEGPEVLSFGLIWLDNLRRRAPVEGLALLVPTECERALCLRLAHLDGARFEVFTYSEEGYAGRVDPGDRGNLDTRLDVACTPSVPAAIAPWLDGICALPYVERVEKNDGSLSLRVRGLEFARVAGGKLLHGLESRQVARAASLPEIGKLAEEVARIRAPGADRLNPLYQRSPELWLESQVRAGLEAIDASLHGTPIYGQVPAFAGGERGVIDLLAVEHSGRLVVLELKASEDIQLPMQALDYWMRVKWHAELGEFSSLGYFPGIPLRPQPPRLLLIAPALCFHPTNEIVLRYFSPAIDVERIGLGVEWQKSVKPVFRLAGARKPAGFA